MRPAFLNGVLGQIFKNKIKYLVLSFIFLTGCMAGYYTMDGISYSFGALIKNNLAARYTADGMDIGAILVSIVFAGIVWLCGFSPAGIVLTPLLLLSNAFIQVFLFRIILVDTDLGGGLLAALCVFVLFFWSAISIYLSEVSVENALSLLGNRDLRMSLLEKSAIVNRKARSYCIAAFLYVLCSYLVFLIDRAIF
ncbi:MAG: hypothetical protein WCP73_01485 [Eubacteriales bacterium]